MSWSKKKSRKVIIYLVIALVALSVALSGFIGREFTIVSYFIAGYFGLLLALNIRDYLRKTYKERAREIDTNDSDKAIVLYLRSFDNVKGYYGHPEEMILNEAVSEIGPMVVIAEPELDMDRPAWEKGAVRLEGGEGDDWRLKVIDLMRDAALVVLRLFPSPGVLWELETAQATIAPERLALYVSPEIDYAALKHRCDEHLQKPLPEKRPVDSHFILFDERWSSRFVSVPITRATRAMYAVDGAHKIMRCELKPVVERLGHRISVPITNSRVMSAALVGLFALMVLGGIAAITWLVVYSIIKPL